MRRVLPLLIATVLVPAAAAKEGKPRPRLVDRTAPALSALTVTNGASPFSGDNARVTTISPNGDGFRDAATIHFRLSEPAQVTLDVARTVTSPNVISELTGRFGAGRHTLRWAPPATLNPRTYVMLLTATDRAGNRSTYGAENAFVSRYAAAPIVRVQGVDAGYTQPSYAPGQLAKLRVATDAAALTLRVFRSGPEAVPTYADNVMNGVEVGDKPVQIDWSSRASAPQVVRFRVGAWESGLYYAQLAADDGRVGYAPFVVRPSLFGTHRVAVVLPTNTWQAYNFYDANADGWGDTWYAGPPNQTVDLSRPYITRGVPPRFHRYDLGFLHWLAWTGKSVDYLSDSDLALVGSGDELASVYDLIVFPGHEEYVTEQEYDLIQRYRDAGGNLAFLSANNFFWRVRKAGQVLRRAGQWRQLGRPEAALLGVQYRANDDGRLQGLFVVKNAAATPWLWDKTGLVDDSTFGEFVGGYGIEIDATTPDSPPQTQVLAEIPNLFGPGISAQMTYYETAAGAKVFAAGAMDFGGSATIWPIRRILQNLWDRLSQP